MWKWIVFQFDLMLYRIAFHSIGRLCKSDPGRAYLFYLWICRWREQNPCDPDLERFVRVWIWKDGEPKK